MPPKKVDQGFNHASGVEMQIQLAEQVLGDSSYGDRVGDSVPVNCGPNGERLWLSVGQFPEKNNE